MTEFGRDISCTTSLRTGRYSTGLRLVAEAAFRRLSTRRGTLQGGVDEENYGLDLSSLIGSTATEADAAGLPWGSNGNQRSGNMVLMTGAVAISDA